MPLSTFFQSTVPAYLRGLPLTKLETSPFTLSAQDWVTVLPFLLAIWVALVIPIVAFAVALKTRVLHKGLFQFSSHFYSGTLSAAVPFIANVVPAVLALAGAYLGGYWVWLMFVVGYGLVPIVDLIVGDDSYNPTKEQEAALKSQPGFKWLLWAYVPIQIVSTTYIAYRVSTGSFSTLEVIGMTISAGTAAGFGIGCVHELTHRPSYGEFALAVISVTWTSYGHFPVEHLFGHHKRVATDEDPASSALGESVYTFLPRVWWGSFVSAWDIERRYLAKRGEPLISIHNRILLPYLGTALLFVLHYWAFGAVGALFWFFQGIISSLTLENVNYIEHYGLRRRKLLAADGTPIKDAEGEQAYERPGWFHAWNSADRVTNYLLFKIQRHPDHHTNAGRPYQVLRTFKESPTLPTGYAGMVLLSWFPPLWRWVMDPLVAQAYTDREAMEAAGLNYFPSGSNNVSSAFKKQGEGFFQLGEGEVLEDAEKSRVVWETPFDELEKKAAFIGKKKNSTTKND